MPTASPLLLLPQREITLAGEPAVMACTLGSIWRCEQVVGKNPPPGRQVTRAWLWSLLTTFQPGLTVRDVGALEPREYAAAMEAAKELMTPPKERAQGAQAQSDKPLDWFDTWAIGRFDLGLSEAEFWHLSPGLFDALWKRFEEADERRLYGHAMVCAEIWNVKIDPEKTARFSPDLFMPGKRSEKAAKAMVAEQRAGMKAKLRDGLALLGGRKKK